MAATPQSAEAFAELYLSGVGDAALGEWREFHRAFHIRRRLTDDECRLGGGLMMRDIRNTDEASGRMAILFADAPELRGFLTEIV